MYRSQGGLTVNVKLHLRHPRCTVHQAFRLTAGEKFWSVCPPSSRWRIFFIRFSIIWEDICVKGVMSGPSHLLAGDIWHEEDHKFQTWSISNDQIRISWSNELYGLSFQVKSIEIKCHWQVNFSQLECFLVEFYLLENFRGLPTSEY